MVLFKDRYSYYLYQMRISIPESSSDVLFQWWGYEMVCKLSESSVCSLPAVPTVLSGYPLLSFQIHSLLTLLLTIGPGRWWPSWNALTGTLVPGFQTVQPVGGARRENIRQNERMIRVIRILVPSLPGWLCISGHRTLSRILVTALSPSPFRVRGQFLLLDLTHCTVPSWLPQTLAIRL